MSPVVAGGPAVPPNQEEVAKRSKQRGVENDSRSRFNAAALAIAVTQLSLYLAIEI